MRFTMTLQSGIIITLLKKSLGHQHRESLPYSYSFCMNILADEYINPVAILCLFHISYRKVIFTAKPRFVN